MLTLTDTQKCTLTIAPVDAKGNPAAVDGVPEWTSSAPSIVSVSAAADGLSAEIVAVGPLGAAQISVAADADLTAGLVPLTGLLDVLVIGGQAVSLGIAAGAPTEQP